MALGFLIEMMFVSRLDVKKTTHRSWSHDFVFIILDLINLSVSGF